MDYQAKLKQLYRRKNNISNFSDSVDFYTQASIGENKALKYIVKSMESVEDSYRNNTIEAAKKVANHLTEFNCEFELQGSVTTQTEIVQNSDVDIVVITNKAVTKENGVPIHKPYHGDLTNDLKYLRQQCEQKLKTIYKEVKTDGAKSIEVYLSDPRRKVDVVVANWYETYDYYVSNQEHQKGIYLYDKKNNTRIGPDFPFLRSYNINNHLSSSKIKKIIRFLKNFREDFEIQNLTSFQINCIAYNLQYDFYHSIGEVDLLKKLINFLPKQGYYIKIDSPCKKEKVRINHNAKLKQALQQLISDASHSPYESEIY